MSLRPQDPIPDWITHLAILGRNHTLALAGPKEEVLFAVYRWANAYMSPRNSTAAKMAALMTREYGRPLLDIGHTLTSTGVYPYLTGSSITSSNNPVYVHPTGELAPEYLSLADQKAWHKAAENSRQDADLHDLLALTSLLPAAFRREAMVKSCANQANSVDKGLDRNHQSSVMNEQLQPRLGKPLIELSNVVVSYGTKTILGHGVQPGFNAPGLNLKLCEGTRLAVLGPNGSGKTTLLSLLTSDHPKSYSLPIKYFGRSRLPSLGKPGLSLWEIQSRIGHSSPEIHTFFPKSHTIRRSLESAWADAFAAKPKLSETAIILVDAFLRWWEPELNPEYHPSPSANASIARGDPILTSHLPFKHHAKTTCELDWASSPINAFGTLSFQTQRLLLFLRAIIKSPDIVILDEAFSGFSPDVRDKAMLFLAVGEAYMLLRQSDAAHSGSTAHVVVSAEGRFLWARTGNSSEEVEIICRQVGITLDELAIGKKKKLVHRRKRKTERSMVLRQWELIAKAAHTYPAEDCAFEGLNSQQALIVVSHVREEIPGMVNEYVRLPGEEEVSEQGRNIEMGTCDAGSIRTAEVWNKIWGLGT
jgi:ABC-type molybdenum transport system ATPase subunit/photorepair protein PhrA